MESENVENEGFVVWLNSNRWSFLHLFIIRDTIIFGRFIFMRLYKI